MQETSKKKVKPGKVKKEKLKHAGKVKTCQKK